MVSGCSRASSLLRATSVALTVEQVIWLRRAKSRENIVSNCRDALSPVLVSVSMCSHLHPLFFSMFALHPGQGLVFAFSQTLLSSSDLAFACHLATISHWQGLQETHTHTHTQNR